VNGGHDIRRPSSITYFVSETGSYLIPLETPRFGTTTRIAVGRRPRVDQPEPSSADSVAIGRGTNADRYRSRRFVDSPVRVRTPVRSPTRQWRTGSDGVSSGPRGL